MDAGDGSAVDPVAGRGDFGAQTEAVVLQPELEHVLGGAAGLPARAQRGRRPTGPGLIGDASGAAVDGNRLRDIG
jgi:hypothetical protein